MVNITDFFGKNKSDRTSIGRPQTVPAKGKPSLEVIDLDQEDAGQEQVKSLKRQDADDSLMELEPPRAAKRAKTEEQPSIQKLDKNSKITAQDVLASIQSVDLDQVHVKEDTKFNFRAAAASTSGENDSILPSDVPEGQPDCLLGLTIVFTGTLPNIERGTAESLAKRYGARVTKSISSKTSVVVLGDEAGPKKLEKIKQLNIKAINEDGFKQLIAGMPASGGAGDAAEKARKKLEEQQQQAIKEAEELARKEADRAQKTLKAQSSQQFVSNKDLVREQDKLWTVKYAPLSLSQICGNKGAVTKLMNWLANWESNKRTNFKNPGRDGSGVFRAAMLYGPPGIGKTTAAHIVAKELGYDVLEQNASDVRSKSLLNVGVKNALGNMSVVGYFKQNGAHQDEQDTNGKKFVVIMDEVDGMSGGDRGGVGQLAQFCRKTTTPMILICNERNLPKMRPFDRNCLELQFRRPDANSIKARLMTIAVREKFKLDPNIVDRLVQATRGDIRQIINLLSTVSKTTKNINHENITEISQAWEKNIALKPFDITHKLLSGGIYTEMGSNTFTLNDKIALYFDDFDFTPLMIQENYLNTKPSLLNRGQTPLQAVAQAAEYLSEGDLVERKIRSSEQLWSLLPLHAVLSSVLPASKVAGHLTGRVNFTTWLGQNSKMGKYYRLLQELQYHTRSSTSTDKLGLRLEYMPTLKKRLLNPLLKQGADGIPDVIQIMDDYYLTKEDWDSIMDFMVGPEATAQALKKIPTAVKSGFTRKYNSTTHPVAIYRTGTSITAGGGGRTSTPDFEDVVDADDAAVPVEEDNDDESQPDLKKDKLIKQKVRSAKKRTTTKKRAL